MSNNPALEALDFQPCVINFVFRVGLKSELARFVVSFKVTRVPFCGLDLENIKTDNYRIMQRNSC